MPYEPTIGLEIHAELKTATKLFCSCRNDPFGAAEPNLYVCPICLGLPGTLPMMNRQAVEWTALVGMALGCQIGDRLQVTADSTSQKPVTSNLSPVSYSKWDRKNYFYPDLPKGYQISQYDLPIAHGGGLEVTSHKSQVTRIEISRIHLEEDTGKLVHPPGAKHSLIDYNRAGVPLMELVTEPVIQSGQQAAAFAAEYQLLLRTLGVADADMEKGQMRVEANVSVRPSPKPQAPSPKLGTKVEVKNLNSFKSVQKAIAYEIERQTAVLESNELVVQETRGWDEGRQKTVSQRVKETAADYRYFPEPDLPPVTFRDGKAHVSGTKYQGEQGIDLAKIRTLLPELPWQKRQRYQEKLGLPVGDVDRLVVDVERSRYFDDCLNELPSPTELARLLANWILNELPDTQIAPQHLVELAQQVHSQKMTSKLAKELLPKLRSTGENVRVILKREGLEVVRETSALKPLVKTILANHPQAVRDYRAGKAQAMSYLVGQVMAKTRGQADPTAVRQLLEAVLKEG